MWTDEGQEKTAGELMEMHSPFQVYYLEGNGWVWCVGRKARKGDIKLVCYWPAAGGGNVVPAVGRSREVFTLHYKPDNVVRVRKR